MADQPRRSLHDYASFDVIEKGYSPEQVDTFLSGLDESISELEELLRESQRRNIIRPEEGDGNEGKSADGIRGDEMVGHAVAQGQVVMENAQARAREILATAETQASRLLSEAREEAEKVAAAPVPVDEGQVPHEEHELPAAIYRRSGKDRRSGRDRRRVQAKDWKGPERRSGRDRRSGRERRSDSGPGNGQEST